MSGRGRNDLTSSRHKNDAQPPPNPPSELFALVAAVAFAAGLNLYLTLSVLGLLSRFGHLPLPPGLQLIQTWPVIAAALSLSTVEFFADTAFDLLWNALHTFIRVPVAALFAYQATKQLSPQHQLLATLLGGLIALAAHGGKTAVRAAVTPSPEPLSNITLSLGEDALALGLTWLATRHPDASRHNRSALGRNNPPHDPPGDPGYRSLIPRAEQEFVR